MTYIDPTAKLLYHIDRLADIADGRQPPPVNVEIDLSNRCNLGCRDCHFAHVHSKGPHERARTHNTGDLMRTDLAIDILRQLDVAGVRSVTWTGGGEPMLHPDFMDIIGAGWLDQGLYTNGTYIDANKAAVLKNRMRWVYVSLDRYTRDSYRAYKRTDAFDRAVLGIRHLVRATGQATVGVGFLLDATYWEDAQDMAEMALDLGADYVQFRPMIGPDAGWIETARPMLIWLAQQKGVILDLSRFYLYRAWAGHGYPRCHWTQLQTVITPDARVWTCVNRRGFDGDCLGDLTTEPFEMIWRRSGAKLVDGRCRVMCRGHIANLTLDKVMGEQPEHGGFI